MRRSRSAPRAAIARLWLCALAAVLLPAAEAATPAVIRVEMREFAFQPATLRVPAGRPVRLVLVNRGQIAHQIEAPALRTIPATVVSGAVYVESPGLEIVRVQPGGSATVHILLRRPGRFPFACTIEGHTEAGMTGILDVR